MVMTDHFDKYRQYVFRIEIAVNTVQRKVKVVRLTCLRAFKRNHLIQLSLTTADRGFLHISD
ncbi:unnamed protein product [Hymenolepis diminuta]|uniref:Uncharacterized protein n=1 Tax=Hymenolepis diminuta TaxID=6216 RepID=A0A564Y630_HYMDI|nr:unnamed protein product [Hymenolepis diminuta]